MRRPSVLFMNRVYPPVRGASGRVLRDLARSFAREGWQVTVITTGPKAMSERDGAVRVIRVKGSERMSGVFGYMLVWIKMVIAALRLPRTHLLVTMTDPPLFVVAGGLIKSFKRNHHMHWCQDLYPDVLPSLGSRVPGFIEGFLRGVSRHAMRSADKVIVVGRCMARHLSQDGFDPKQITVIPNWPDFELLSADSNGLPPGPANDGYVECSELEGCRIHEQQVKHGPKFRVLYAGNIGRAHPIDTVLKAAEQLNDDQPDIEFVFVGDGPRYDEIAKERSKRHLDNVKLLPFQPVNRLKELMESGDVHLISMREEAAGMIVPSKLYSSLAVQRPCVLVGPEHSEVAKVIHDFEAGSVVAQGAADELAEEIRQLRLNSDKWFHAHAGAANAAQVFVPQESINAWIERAWSVVETDVRQ